MTDREKIDHETAEAMWEALKKAGTKPKQSIANDIGDAIGHLDELASGDQLPPSAREAFQEAIDLIERTPAVQKVLHEDILAGFRQMVDRNIAEGTRPAETLPEYVREVRESSQSWGFDDLAARFETVATRAEQLLAETREVGDDQ